MIKSELLTDLFLNSMEANVNKWQLNFEQGGSIRSKWVVAKEEDKLLVKQMFMNIKRRGLDEKRQVTNMYKIAAIPDKENRRNEMLGKYS
jgi:hypothetical protein